MNLTDNEDDIIYYPERMCAAHMRVANKFAEAKNIAADRGRLGELGSIFSKLVAIKDKLTPSFVKSSKLAANLIAPVESLLYHSEKNAVIPLAGKYGNIIAPVAAFFGPWGKLVAVGVTLARQDYVETQNNAKAIQQTRGNAAQLLDQYNKLAGTVPGRVIGTDTLKDILRAQVVSQQWPPIKEDSEPKSPAIRTFFENINKAAQNGIARGAISANDVYQTEWPDTFVSDPNQQWMAPHDKYQAQLTLDALDDAMAKIKSDLPFSYGVSDAAAADPAAQVTASAQWYPVANEKDIVKFTGTRQVRYGANGKFITKTMTANNGGVMCTNEVFGNDPILGTVKACYLLSSEDAGTPAPVLNASVLPSPTTQQIQPIAQAPVATIANTVPALNNDQQAMMQTLLNQLQAQGASQQQMNSALISALTQTGVDTSSSAVQQAVSADVAATKAAAAQGAVVPVSTAGVSGLPSWAMWGLLGLTAIFALGRPKNVPRGTRARSRSRRRK